MLDRRRPPVGDRRARRLERGVRRPRRAPRRPAHLRVPARAATGSPSRRPRRRRPRDEPFWEAVHRLDAATSPPSWASATPSGLETAAARAVGAGGAGARTTRRLDGLRYGIEWVATDPAPGNRRPGDRWLVVAGGDGHRLEARVLARDGRARPEHRDPDRGARRRPRRAGRPARRPRRRLRRRAVAARRRPRGPDAGPDVALLTGTLALFQALGDAGVAAPALVRHPRGRRASAATRSTRPRAALWGFGRVGRAGAPAALGRPGRPARRAGRLQLERLCALLTAPDAEDQLAVRAEPTFARRLVRRRAPSVAGRPGSRAAPSWSPAAPAPSARRSRAGWPSAAPSTSCCSAGAAPTADWVAELRERPRSPSRAATSPTATRLREVLGAIPEHRPLPRRGPRGGRARRRRPGRDEAGAARHGARAQGGRRVEPARLTARPRPLRPVLLGRRRPGATRARPTTRRPTPTSTRSPSTARRTGCPPARSPGAPGPTAAWRPTSAVTRRMARAGMTALGPDRRSRRSARCWTPARPT